MILGEVEVLMALPSDDRCSKKPSSYSTPCETENSPKVVNVFQIPHACYMLLPFNASYSEVRYFF
jgi:hypothetical protein